MSFSLEETARAHGDLPALVFDDHVLSWDGVAERARALSVALPGDGSPLAIRAARTEETALRMLAAIDAEVALAPLHPSASEPLRDDATDGLPSRAGDGVLAYLRTSGSTGPARLAVLSRRAFAASAAASAEVLPLGPGDRWLLAMPLSHVGGLSILTRALASGAAAVFAPEGSFEAAKTVARIRAQGVTHASFVPTMLSRILDGGHRAPETLRAVLIGGAPATPQLLERARAAGFPVLPTYGLTEACSQVATRRPGDTAEAPGRIGPPLPGVEVRIVDGEIQVRGATLFDGYLGDAPGAQNAPHVDVPSARTRGWFGTGDLGRIDDAGALFVTGRRGDVIITGGENVHPLEVEAALLAHPAVEAVCVVGVPDREWGERVVAAVVGDLGAGDEERLLAWLRPRLAAHQRPREIRVFAAIPETATGKPHRGEVRRLFADA